VTGTGAAGGAAHAERFTALRPLLFTIAYEILGSATEADDVLQDGYLRWAAVDLATVHDTRSYLARLVTRQALNARRAASRRREDYVGPWLPEPVLLDDAADLDPALAESVSMAMLVVLETLGPEERAVFVLREVFGFDHEEIADAVGRPAATVRQIAHRAREHVRARRLRFQPAGAETERTVERFLAAAATGDVAGLVAVLAPDVVWTADGGGKASAARRPVTGAARTASMIAGLFRLLDRMPDVTTTPVVANGVPAVVLRSAGRIEGIYLMDVVDGLITRVYAVRNPDKLAGIASPRTVGR
jgi:RNA polymerase sigma-70 factor, ECF subfamily